ncbi:MAG: ABC transporter ATP-binding protein [Spirochaetales bacterium]|nr:MAG: ABC transporter ATP-binding protein [Spirochaetales bacterium]
MMKAFEGTSITRTFGNLLVLEDVSLSMDTGEFLALLGPSGCGKTTLLSIMAGLLSPDSGTILFNGKSLSRETADHPSFMMQKDLLLPWKKVIDNITLPLVLGGAGKKEARGKVIPLLAGFGLSGFENLYPRELSGGMRQRAALLRTWLADRDMMLLDEPFGSLDALTRRKMQLWLADVRKRFGMTILMVTHDVEEAVFLADRILILSPRPARIMEEITVNRDKVPEIDRIRSLLLSLEENT